MKAVIGYRLAAVCLASGLVLAIAAQAKVARTTLGELVRSADAVVIARVESVPSYDGLAVARAVPVEVLKGGVGPGPFHFVASPTWSCDMSAAIRGETALLLLDAAKTDRFSRKGHRTPGARVPVTPLYTLTRAGRGRFPERIVNGQSHLLLPFDVGLPEGVPVVPGRGSERTAPRDRLLETVRTELKNAEPRTADTHRGAR